LTKRRVDRRRLGRSRFQTNQSAHARSQRRRRKFQGRFGNRIQIHQSRDESLVSILRSVRTIENLADWICAADWNSGRPALLVSRATPGGVTTGGGKRIYYHANNLAMSRGFRPPENLWIRLDWTHNGFIRMRTTCKEPICPGEA